MIHIYTDEVNPDVRCVPACELFGGADDGELVVEIQMNAADETELVLQMPRECAEELYHALAFHFDVEGKGK